MNQQCSAERDPHGLDQHQLGAKLDAGKPRPSLVLGDFSRALRAVTDIGTFGAAKYTDRGWLSVVNGLERYDDALMRHWLREHSGEDTDPDSGFLHAAHAAWNALAKLELILREKEHAVRNTGAGTRDYSDIMGVVVIAPVDPDEERAA